MEKAAIYCRLSKEDLDESNESESIQNQKNMLLEYADKMGWSIFDIYIDDGISAAYSGAENTRPAFLKMIDDAKHGRFNIVLCKSQSRFSRNSEVIERYLHGLFTEKGIRFIGLVDYADTSVKSNKKARQINGLINEWYLEDLSENVKSVLINKMKRGEYIGSFAPYGYKKDLTNHNRLIVNADTANVVKMIFNWSIQGYGTVKISRMLNDMNIPNPRKQQEKDGLRKIKMYADNDSGKWSPSTINDILHNVEYTGCTAQHKAEKLSYKHKKVRKLDCGDWIIVENTHEPIISKSDFAKVQTNMQKKRKADGTGKAHILSGLIYCAECNSSMQKNYNNRYVYLRCREKYLYSECRCKTPNIRLDFILENMGYDFIKDIITEFAEKNKSQFNLNEDMEYSSMKKRLAELENEYKKYDNAKKSLYIDKCAGVISQAEYEMYKRDFEYAKRGISENMKNMQTQIEKKSDNGGTTENILEKTNIEKIVLDNVLDKIIFGRRKGSDIMELKFVWNI